METGVINHLLKTSRLWKVTQNLEKFSIQKGSCMMCLELEIIGPMGSENMGPSTKQILLKLSERMLKSATPCRAFSCCILLEAVQGQA